MVFKPVVGAVDLVTQTAEGIKNTTKLGDELQMRVRPPRMIDADGILRRYQMRDAFGQELICTAEKGKYQNEHHVAHIVLSKEHYLVLTMNK